MNKFSKYYIGALKKYAVFRGRAGRAEYWYFVLFSAVISIIFEIIEGPSDVLSSIYNLAVLLPSVGVGVRRMHDVNKSGWFILVPIYNLILALRKGTKGENRFGSDPRTNLL